MSLIRADSDARAGSQGRYALAVAGIVTIALAAFLLAPGDVATKTHLALHGLCAQRPSHSLSIGGTVLPLDARMTGIYLGAATTLLWVFATDRMRALRTPPRSVLAVLIAFVATMAIDGFNAFLVDLGAPHLYEPSNGLRLVTGIMAGTALGAMLAYLLAVTVWARVDRERAIIGHLPELLPPMGIAAALGAFALAGLPVSYAPIAVGLLLAAFGVFWILSTVVVTLLWNRGWTCEDVADLAPMALVGVIVAAGTIGALSGARLLAEHFLGLPRLS